MRKTLMLLLIVLLLPIAHATADQDMLSPTTGLPAASPYRPVMALLSNASEARQSLCLSLADIVYEAIYWGPGHTRYIAIYNEFHPTMVGSIRSARPYHGILRDEWDCPLVFWNTRDTNRPFYDVYTHFDIMNTPSTFLFSGLRPPSTPQNALFRTTQYRPPHNGFANIQLIATEGWPNASSDSDAPHAPQLPSLRFSETPSQGDGGVNTIHIEYDAKDYTATYAYDETTRRYTRLYNGTPMKDAGTGASVMADNVIVQLCDHSYVNEALSMPEIALMGRGTFDAYIEGQRISGTWAKDAPEAPTLFSYMDGDVRVPLTLRPGKTFIQIFPVDGEVVDSIDEDGSVRYVRP